MTARRPLAVAPGGNVDRNGFTQSTSWHLRTVTRLQVSAERRSRDTMSRVNHAMDGMVTFRGSSEFAGSPSDRERRGEAGPARKSAVMDQYTSSRITC